ncbi:DUF6912 family protein [Desertihabitans aurantiacus]|uniref:DUF6912 family protein n=1 Tax=Desertihabitans aurantiacus TaxID=2282477 RepID=UPI001300171E|nr:hypothetical protein [Desertihabitans aurantiacus]
MRGRERRMVFCATVPQRLELLATAGTLEELGGRTATGALARGHGLAADATEELDYLAQELASLDSLLEGAAQRVVLAVDADADAVEVVDERSGLVRLRPFDWERVTAVFVDEAEARPAVERARSVLADDPLRLAEPQRPEQVAELLAEHPLLWYLPTEREAVSAVLAG